MKTIKRISFIVMVFTAFFFTACNSDSTSKENQTDSTEVDTTNTDMQMQEVVYQIPSPDELFALIKNSGCKFRDDLLNSDKTIYESKSAQELNLGIYAADLAYLAAFEKFQPSLKYFAKVKSMSDQIGISTAIGNDMYSRLEKNITNSDSLLSITNNSYYNVVQKLEESGNGETLALLMESGWIESVYITVNIFDKYSESNPTIQRLASQKVTFGNMVKNLEKYKDNPDIATQITNLDKLKQIFDQIKKEAVADNTTQKTDTSKVVIGQKSKYIFPKDLFESFKKEIVNLRSQIVKMS
jgi:hypothetical protein